MTHEEKLAEVEKRLKNFKTAFPSARAGSESLRIYANCLSDIPLTLIEASLVYIAKNNTFFPSINEIRETARMIYETTNNNTVPLSADAWEEALRLARAHGLMKPWNYSHPLVEQAVKAIGRQEICTMESRSEGVVRAHFMQIYDQFRNKAKTMKEINALAEKFALVASQVKEIES